MNGQSYGKRNATPGQSGVQCNSTPRDEASWGEGRQSFTRAGSTNREDDVILGGYTCRSAYHSTTEDKEQDENTEGDTYIYVNLTTVPYPSVSSGLFYATQPQEAKPENPYASRATSPAGNAPTARVEAIVTNEGTPSRATTAVERWLSNIGFPANAIWYAHSGVSKWQRSKRMVEDRLRALRP
ncbi:hypothetical protein FA13DRAFT_1716646 [Coprinellus micaceus]|uniref:Uncharacterized protein n=1 Tax=Coprinellus micaceus TaxID=71717 RepID=A0A4Y7SIR5_COPMI|nr:hypothetical protein FA13DRAFT_1716646 [Coprinellus micaceus]